jgi:hypothetical protein
MQVEDVSLTVGVGGNIGSEIFEKARGIGLVGAASIIYNRTI